MRLLPLLALAFTSVLGAIAAELPSQTIVSPNGELTVEVTLTAEGAARYAIARGGQPVLQPSRLGLIRDDVDFTHGLKLISASPAESVHDAYEIQTAKRRRNTYHANRRVLHFETAQQAKLDVVFQVSNDGVAFRYVFPDTSAEVRRLKDEVTSFHFLPETRAWLQPMAEAKTGWSRTNPSYEEYYQMDIPVGTPSPLAGWVYPALFRSGDTWLLVSETALDRNYCGTRLRRESPDGEYSVGFPDERERVQGGAVYPESHLPWATPWRIVVVGTLKTVAESMLGVDLSPGPVAQSTVTPKPGRASWSWPLLGDGATTYDVQRRFIDYAAEMGWEYCLIDALWDQQIGYEKTKELIDYAKSKNVAILLWYNSAGDWNEAPQTPRDLMLTRDSRLKEFTRLKEMGVAGLKIDFFGGDGQSMINYYHDIMEEAAPFGFMLNFHGCTLPRGWHRTYPHLMTMEAIRGLEFVTFGQENADQEPTHATVLPFTRNVFDPMDFTPVVLDRIPNGNVARRTTSAFELALSVLFQSGIQHFAEIPEGLAQAPEYVRDFLKRVPAAWEDVRFIDGFPGRFVVLARRSSAGWFVAGINGEDTEKRLSLNLSEIGVAAGAQLPIIRDGAEGNLSFVREMTNVGPQGAIEVKLAPRGGFVIFLEAVR